MRWPPTVLSNASFTSTEVYVAVRAVLGPALMVALYRVGRQVDVLAVYRNARRVIREQLGVEPDRSLREVQQAILRGDLECSGAPSWAP